MGGKEKRKRELARGLGFRLLGLLCRFLDKFANGLGFRFQHLPLLKLSWCRL